jgi:hypothetical protein
MADRARRSPRTTRERAVRAHADDRNRGRKRAQTGARNRTSLDRPERGRASPPHRDAHPRTRPARGRRAADAARRSIGAAPLSAPAGGPMVVLNSPCRLHGLLPASSQGPHELRHARRPHTLQEETPRPAPLRRPQQARHDRTMGCPQWGENGAWRPAFRAERVWAGSSSRCAANRESRRRSLPQHPRACRKGMVMRESRGTRPIQRSPPVGRRPVTCHPSRTRPTALTRITAQIRALRRGCGVAVVAEVVPTRQLQQLGPGRRVSRTGRDRRELGSLPSLLGIGCSAARGRQVPDSSARSKKAMTLCSYAAGAAEMPPV